MTCEEYERLKVDLLEWCDRMERLEELDIATKYVVSQARFLVVEKGV